MRDSSHTRQIGIGIKMKKMTTKALKKIHQSLSNSDKMPLLFLGHRP